MRNFHSTKIYVSPSITGWSNLIFFLIFSLVCEKTLNKTPYELNFIFNIFFIISSLLIFLYLILKTVNPEKLANKIIDLELKDNINLLNINNSTNNRNLILRLKKEYNDYSFIEGDRYFHFIKSKEDFFSQHNISIHVLVLFFFYLYKLNIHNFHSSFATIYLVSASIVFIFSLVILAYALLDKKSCYVTP